jgi:hypothetical protein
MAEETTNPIDLAISNCELQIGDHKVQSNRTFRQIIYSLIGLVVVIFGINYINYYNQVHLSNLLRDSQQSSIQIYQDIETFNHTLLDESSSYSRDTALRARLQNDFSKYMKNLPVEISSSSFKIDTTIQYFFYGIFIFIFGVFTSFYRFHLKEISKYEHFLFGLHRIRIAGNNSQKGFDDEVRTSLTKDAFANEARTGVFSKDRRVESPIPGHPTSDFASMLFNKVLESIDFTAKKKEEKPPGI